MILTVRRSDAAADLEEEFVAERSLASCAEGVVEEGDDASLVLFGRSRTAAVERLVDIGDPVPRVPGTASIVRDSCATVARQSMPRAASSSGVRR